MGPISFPILFLFECKKRDLVCFLLDIVICTHKVVDKTRNVVGRIHKSLNWSMDALSASLMFGKFPSEPCLHLFLRWFQVSTILVVHAVGPAYESP